MPKLIAKIQANFSRKNSLYLIKKDLHIINLDTKILL